ncbi:hypothetical protein SAU060112_20349 [Staphylococcus aureus]|nr:hypothetical protein SAU060112_20349 [Staphylococcus aureus]
MFINNDSKLFKRTLMSVCFEALYNKGRCFKLRNKNNPIQ